MKTLNTQTVAKPSYVKTKAFGLCGTLALATALLIGAGTVSADENAAPVVDAQPAVSNVYTADNSGNITVTPSETVVPTETPVATTEVATPAPVTEAPTSVAKEGDTITVTNPDVQVDFPNGTGKYSPFEVEYKDINFPDDMAINEGDKVTFDLPQEVKFQTSYEFDVHNPEKAVVGKATADANTNKVTTVFNDYFKTHPLNKSMSLKLDASWTDKVVSGKPVTANFNGTLVTTNIGSEQVIGKDELIAKWGSQDKDDPTVINWTARVNYAKRVLNYVTIIDEMSENQKLVDNFFEVKNIESVDPWIDKGDAMDLVKSISKSDHGFTIKMDRLDHMIYVNYKTKLVNAVKDSTNPTNKIELKAESDGAVSYMKIQLVGGRGDASGENKPEPTFEIPHDAPKVDIPEFEGGIPGIPEVRELPEYTEPIGTVPNEAPVHDKPEFQGGIPGIPEVRELPPFEGGVVPNDAPILDLPELEIPEEPTKPTPEKPSTPEKASKTSAERSNGEMAQSATVSYNLAPVSKETPKTAVYGGTLPHTGEKEGIMSTLGLAVIAVGIAGFTLSFKKYNEGEEE
ncbi:SIALI-17 repeat-containing surface protein [Streptococcus salivarius]|jgi:lpxtg cell wall surface protein, collagen binding domain protein|uniref:SIALI-17 repeat-containing surface protein n=1 Tax=Streptococcus salivarius TaxID=1304 RepID=UPI00066AB96D|nr:SIALI-17 repeat-containing surface protein [Streptococcus salivarius]